MSRPRTLVIVLVAVLVVIASYVLGGIGEEPAPADVSPVASPE